jgi:hypothetical protein
MSVQPSLLDSPVMPSLESLLVRNSACARLARLLLARRGEWIDGKVIATVAGGYAWRTRISNLRKEPWFLDVKNRYRHVNEDGRKFVISEYMLSAEAGVKSHG